LGKSTREEKGTLEEKLVKRWQLSSGLIRPEKQSNRDPKAKQIARNSSKFASKGGFRLDY